MEVNRYINTLIAVIQEGHGQDSDEKGHLL